MRNLLVPVIMVSKSRWFVVTQWNLECKYQELVNAGQIKFVAVGEETCPSTGRKHHQVFCYFHNPHSEGKRSLAKIGSMWGPIHCYVAVCRGTMEENVAYCSKDGHYTEYGDKPKQGCRTDLESIKDDILVGNSSVDDIAVESPMLFHQYGRTLDRLEGIALRKRYRTEMTKGIWFTGPAGTGKSHKCFEGFTPETHYVKNLNEEWWDGYKGQETVILNEFRGQIAFSELLDLCDKWPKSVKWRNREPVPFLAKTIVVASIKSPRECYYNALLEDEPWEQFERRFTIVQLEQRCSEGNIIPLSNGAPHRMEGAYFNQPTADGVATSPFDGADAIADSVESLLSVDF